MGRKNLTFKQLERRRRLLRWAGIRRSTLRDWLPILIAAAIPILIFLGTRAITLQQADLENQRAEAERELADQRAQDEALQAYLDQMSLLLLEKNLRNSEVNSEVRTLARARTLTVLERLDPSRKDNVIRFLSETSLINDDPTDQKALALVDGDVVGKNINNTDLQHDWSAISPEEVPVISLGARADPLEVGGPAGADLNGSNLVETALDNANLSNANLSNAKLKYASLIAANLSDASLSDANLYGADLSYADLSYAVIKGANLDAAYLDHADLSMAHLNNTDLIITRLGGADLSFTGLTNTRLVGSELRYADLTGANLSHADLERADLSEAKLDDANLSNADLSNADLSGANMQGARGVTSHELGQAYSLKGATMPDGQRYEEWIKDKEAQGKDVKNE